MANTNEEQYKADVDNFLGDFDAKENCEAALSTEELRQRLSNAQNENRGHPRKGVTPAKLMQMNVSCLKSLSEQFTNISLKTGKTKKALMEEAIKQMMKKYAK